MGTHLHGYWIQQRLVSRAWWPHLLMSLEKPSPLSEHTSLIWIACHSASSMLGRNPASFFNPNRPRAKFNVTCWLPVATYKLDAC